MAERPRDTVAFLGVLGGATRWQLGLDLCSIFKALVLSWGQHFCGVRASVVGCQDESQRYGSALCCRFLRVSSWRLDLSGDFVQPISRICVLCVDVLPRLQQRQAGQSPGDHQQLLKR
ncbi:uncharacterized protein PV07_06022 [Cladophialophora immunda]|uniref:Uncharacterized protein n=1 Tax=Cladophialophora immunda TaxID=569365 RepID=A0A0D1ZQG0_9EURO|nr:uncharacterized protein PV07_06022 [Cladophialophora immunda]KIW30266.1 hypothetical protein PV07_06022 [Cladophialophora immunda]